MSRTATTVAVCAFLALCAHPIITVAAGQAIGESDGASDLTDSYSATARVSVYMLAAQIRSIAGHRVEVFGARVSSVVSPRVFVLEHDGPHIGRSRQRVAVILERGQAIAPPGVGVVVTGAARTALGARLTPTLPPISEEEFNGIGALPVVVASEVRTPGGISLVQLAPAAAP